jgi:hypothetical protein
MKNPFSSNNDVRPFVSRTGIRDSPKSLLREKENPLASGGGGGSGESEFGGRVLPAAVQSPDAATAAQGAVQPTHVFLAVLSTFWARFLRLNANPVRRRVMNARRTTNHIQSRALTSAPKRRFSDGFLGLALNYWCGSPFRAIQRSAKRWTCFDKNSRDTGTPDLTPSSFVRILSPPIDSLTPCPIDGSAGCGSAS